MALAGFLLCSSCKEQFEKPNVLLIVVDDLGWKDLGCFGSDYYHTPNVDQLAEDGIRFTSSYSACTVCSPTRASIMTGKYPARLNCTDWIEGHKYPNAKLRVPDWTMYLDDHEQTMAELFKDAGYQTAHFGKWHLGEDEENWPDNHGFDLNIGGWAKGAPNKNKRLGSKGYFAPYGNPRLSDGPDGEYLTERLADEVCSYIDSRNKQPLFINLWFYNVHTPLQATQEKIDKFKALQDSSKLQKNPIYAAMVEHMDDAVGKVINKLKDEGLYENTIVLFTSDNGGLIGLGEYKITNNTPLRSGKGDMYEGGVRIPTILRFPGNKQKGRSIDEAVISIDYLPTLADLAGIKEESYSRDELDGLSWMPLISGQAMDREAIYWHYPHYHTEGARPYSAIRKGDWKLVQNYHDQRVELFNLANDPGETKNLIEEHPGIAKELSASLEAWKVEVGAQMPSPNPDFHQENQWKKEKLKFY